MFKKQEHCNPDDRADDHYGDWWDHVALDPESRLVLAVVPGARGAEAVEEVVAVVPADAIALARWVSIACRAPSANQAHTISATTPQTRLAARTHP